jgi:hypothetical protein
MRGRLVVEPLKESELSANFSVRVAQNQRRLAENILSEYDFVICGAGSTGSVVACGECQREGAAAGSRRD